MLGIHVGLVRYCSLEHRYSNSPSAPSKLLIFTCATFNPAFSHRSSVVLLGDTNILKFSSAYNTRRYPVPAIGISKRRPSTKNDPFDTFTVKSAGH